MRQDLIGILKLVAGAAYLLGVCVAGYLYYRSRGLKGHARRRHLRRLVLVFVTPLVVWQAIHFLDSAQRTGPDPLAAILLVVMVCSFGCVLLFKPIRQTSESEARRIYREDPGRCGRCEYDLTGNTTGVCPECGWQLNSEPLEDGQWARWWSHWRIERLPNWREPLLQVSFLMVMGCMFAAIGLLRVKMVLFVAVPVIILAGIQIVRLLSYAVRERRKAIIDKKGRF